MPGIASRLLRRRLLALDMANQELLKARREAEAATRARTEFLASVSHELRTPLNAMIGMLGVLRKTGLTAEQHDYVNLMKGAGASLLAVVNNILDLSRVEAGHFEVENIPFSLRQCVGESIRLLAFEAAQKGLALGCEIDPEVPDALLGDPQRLRQILINLVGNAIKFTARGRIAVRVRLHAGNADEVSCRFSVSDTGIGIPPEQQARIFMPFRQASSATARLYGGSGLGLAISARLVAMMHGKIWLDSSPGRGSTFYFTACFGRHLPAPALPDAPPAAAPVPVTPLNILVVEDNPTNRQLARITLEQAGHRVRLAGSGDAARAMVAEERPDVVLMDVEMPDMDGLQTAAAIRAEEAAHGGHLPIIALTARALPGDRGRCLQAGMDDYLAKPVDPETLLAALQRLGRRLAAPEAPAGRPPVLDRRALLRRVGGDRQLLGEIRDIFRRDCGPLLSAARAALAARDAARFAAGMHTLHGMLRSLGADAARETAARLEEMGVDDEMAETAWQRLEQEVEAVGRALTGLAGRIRR